MPRTAALLLVGAFLAGCAADAPETPVLGNPKLLVDRAPDNATRLYVHSAFGDRAYDRLVLALDNETVAGDEGTYALVHKTDLDAFHVRVEAASGAANYSLEALVRFEEDEVLVAVHDGETFGDFRATDLPWQKIVEEARAPEVEA